MSTFFAGVFNQKDKETNIPGPINFIAGRTLHQYV